MNHQENNCWGEIMNGRAFSLSQLLLRITGLLLLFLPLIAKGLTFTLPQGKQNIVGELQVINVESEDTLQRIARREDLGLLELMSANPGIDKNKKLKVGSEIMIPTAFILPTSPRNGIVINVAELRLYFYPSLQNVVMTFPIGIGRDGWETPLSQTYIESKQEFPDWTPPDSIREYTLKTKGYTLPEVVSAGPDNPLGNYAMHLAIPGYLIHSTNQPNSIGIRSSSGCIRMFPEDIEQLFYLVQPGTPVYIIHEPIKVGWFHSELYLEAHQPMPQYANDESVQDKFNLITQGLYSTIQWDKVNTLLKNYNGYPTFVGKTE